MSRFNYNRRISSTVHVGDITLGGNAPIRVQSMTNTSTLDTQGSAEQAMRIAEAGGELVRLTTQGVREADNLTHIRKILDDKGCFVPLVADVHFNPKAAYAAAATCQKVRINPGNFVDAARTFRQLNYTDEEYAAEILRIRDALLPFIDICRRHRTAVRLGVNHGSLSDRIMSRYGDSPEGMVESVMEFLRIFRSENFTDVVISVKASNVAVMVRTVRLLVEAMRHEGMAFPLHLGVTEAGDGEDGRVKSAVGIGTLLNEGIGDTIRVSLSEPPEAEIPVAIALRDYITARQGHRHVVEPEHISDTPTRSLASADGPLPHAPWPLAFGVDFDRKTLEDTVSIDAASPVTDIPDGKAILIRSHNDNPVGEISSWLERYYAAGGKAQAIAAIRYDDTDPELVRLKAGADFGSLLLNGYANAIYIDSTALTDEERDRLELGILQACRLRMSKTEYIACPSCGRTLFDLQTTLAQVKKATQGLKGLKIGVMGCIVNGPGEMADADYGYVGAGPGRVSLYKGKQLLVKNIPAEDALPKLLEIIRADGHEL